MKGGDLHVSAALFVTGVQSISRWSDHYLSCGGRSSYSSIWSIRSIIRGRGGGKGRCIGSRGRGVRTRRRIGWGMVGWGRSGRFIDYFEVSGGLDHWFERGTKRGWEETDGCCWDKRWRWNLIDDIHLKSKWWLEEDNEDKERIHAFKRRRLRKYRLFIPNSLRKCSEWRDDATISNSIRDDYWIEEEDAQTNTQI